MEKPKAFGCHKINKFQLHFPNGNWLSTVWGPMTYSDNYDVEYDLDRLEESINKPLWSDTVEIMFTCSDKLKKKILKKYNDGGSDPIGYLPIDKWLEIVSLLSGEKSTAPA